MVLRNSALMFSNLSNVMPSDHGQQDHPASLTISVFFMEITCDVKRIEFGFSSCIALSSCHVESVTNVESMGLLYSRLPEHASCKMQVGCWFLRSMVFKL